jgi:SAM-dependent methyltransferase
VSPLGGDPFHRDAASRAMPLCAGCDRPGAAGVAGAAPRGLLRSATVDDSLRLRARAARAEIASGALRGPALLEALRAVPFRDRDAWIDELLGIEPPPPDAPDLPRGAVPYLPCGVDEIVTTVQEVPVGPGDELVDLGSGLGRVAVLVHLLSGARTCGIEIQAALVDRARARCTALGLTAVSFVHGDAADAELDGSIFFLYAPFNGDLLARVVRRLAGVARRRPIVVAAVALELPDAPWLIARSTSSAALTLYEPRVRPARSG